MATGDLVVVRTFNDQFAANLAKSALEAAGIECMIGSDNAGGQYGAAMALSNGVKVIVRAEDAARADEILRSENQEM